MFFRHLCEPLASKQSGVSRTNHPRYKYIHKFSGKSKKNRPIHEMVSGIHKVCVFIHEMIWRELIDRHLTYGQQLAISESEWQWEKPDGSLDMNRIMEEFQLFWRQHADLIEIKLAHWYQTPDDVRKKGLEQIRRYRDRFASNIPS